MKNKFFSLFVFLVFMQSVLLLAGNSTTGESLQWDSKKDGYELALNLGWKRISARMDCYEFLNRWFDDPSKGKENGEVGTDKGNLFGFDIVFKNQAPETLYYLLKGSYYWGRVYNNKALDEFTSKKSKYAEGFLKAALGYTFSFYDARTLVSPFVSLSFQHTRHTFDSYFKGDDDLDPSYVLVMDNCVRKRTTRYGIIGMVGVDIIHAFTENIEAGIVASLGIPITGRERYVRNQYDDDNDKDEYGSFSKKMKLKTRLFYEILVPIRYCVSKGKFGIELSHARSDYKSEMHRYLVRTYGIAATGTYVF